MSPIPHNSRMMLDETVNPVKSLHLKRRRSIFPDVDSSFECLMAVMSYFELRGPGEESPLKQRRGNRLRDFRIKVKGPTCSPLPNQDPTCAESAPACTDASTPSCIEPFLDGNSSPRLGVSTTDPSRTSPVVTVCSAGQYIVNELDLDLDVFCKADFLNSSPGVRSR